MWRDTYRELFEGSKIIPLLVLTVTCINNRSVLEDPMRSSAKETSIRVVNKWAMASINYHSPEAVSHYTLYFLKIKNRFFLLFS